MVLSAEVETPEEVIALFTVYECPRAEVLDQLVDFLEIGGSDLRSSNGLEKLLHSMLSLLNTSWVKRRA